ncbi:DUF2271 domain-containing protein [Oligoflexus tunisiensis]|uniref:DUF2271 domain-containing protein n=1 Tax=Oligoflexus tunisiensis TaxID=708132 RepID=UPI00114D2682|nr:DUF2271 domain-containing protein [Oligoflexus tunisiensis]
MKARLLLGFWLSTSATLMPAQTPKDLEIEIELPDIKVEPYHRPYVAIWLETPDRKAVSTIALWWQKDTWLKDLRQWWRRVGKESLAGIDGYSGATRKPGTYKINWKPVDQKGKPLPAGSYVLNFEASREEGGRDHVKQTIELGRKQEIKIPATKELGVISLNIPAL